MQITTWFSFIYMVEAPGIFWGHILVCVKWICCICLPKMFLWRSFFVAVCLTRVLFMPEWLSLLCLCIQYNVPLFPEVYFIYYWEEEGKSTHCLELLLEKSIFSWQSFNPWSSSECRNKIVLYTLTQQTQPLRHKQYVHVLVLYL